MKIRTDTDQELIASTSLYRRLEPVILFSITGTVFYAVSLTFLAILSWLLAGCYLIAALLIPESITIDSVHEIVIIRRLIFGLIPSKHLIPFDRIRAVQIGYRRVLSLATSNWQLTLISDIRTFVISRSTNELRIRHLGSVISRQLGVKFISDTFKPRNDSQDQKFYFRRRW